MPRPSVELKKTDHTCPFGAGSGPFDAAAEAARSKAISLGNGFDIGAWIKQLRLGGDDHLTQAWAQSWIIYSCVRVRAEAVESVPFCLWDRPRDEADREKVETHRVLDLLNRPNAHMDGADLRYFKQGYTDLCGEAFILFGVQEDGDEGRFRAVGPNEFPNVLLPVPGWKLTLYRRANSLGYSKIAYTFDGEGGTVEFEPHAFGLLRNPHLYEWWRGFGPGEGVSRIASRMFQQERYDDALLRNGGAPSLILGTEKTQTPAQIREHQKIIRDRVTSNRARNQPLVLTGDLKVLPYGWAPKDMEHGEMRKWDRDAIMAAFGVTKPLLGITDDVIRANSDAAMEVFWRYTMSNELARSQRQWQRQVVEPLVARAVSTRRTMVYLGFDTSQVSALQESMDEQIDRAVALHTQLGIPVPEAAREAGLDLDDETVAALEAKLEADAEAAAAMQGALAAAQTDDQDEADDEPDSAPGTEERAVAHAVVASVLQGGTRTKLAADALVRLRGFSPAAVERILAAAPAGSFQVREGDRYAEMEQMMAAVDAVARGLQVRSTEEQRRNRATEHDAWLRAWEGKIAKAYNGPARDYVLATRKAVRAYAERELDYSPTVTRAFDEVAFRALLAEIMPGTGDFAEKFGLRMETVTEKMVGEALVQAANDLGLDEPSFDKVSAQMAQLIQEKRVLLAEGVFTTLETRVTDVLTRAFLGGEVAVGGDGDLADAIMAQLEPIDQALGELASDGVAARAQTIARTEAGAIANTAHMAQYDAAGIEKVEWVASGDAATRDTHSELDGKIVERGASFRSDIILRWPHDPKAPAAEIVNCRCTILPVFED